MVWGERESEKRESERMKVRESRGHGEIERVKRKKVKE